MGQANVVFLGPSRDWTQIPIAILPFDGTFTLGDLKRALCDRFPELSLRLDAIRFAINDRFAADDDVIQDGDEVAVIPPVSGG